jgi:hypothetical protein
MQRVYASQETDTMATQGTTPILPGSLPQPWKHWRDVHERARVICSADMHLSRSDLPTHATPTPASTTPHWFEPRV